MYKSDNQNKNVISSGIQFDRLRKVAAKAHSELMKGRPGHSCSEETKLAVSLKNKGNSYTKGQTRTQATKNLIGIKSKGRCSGDKNPMKNKEVVKKHSGVWRSDNNPSKIKIVCEFCGTIAGKGNYTKWHGLNCRNK